MLSRVSASTLLRYGTGRAKSRETSSIMPKMFVDRSGTSRRLIKSTPTRTCYMEYSTVDYRAHFKYPFEDLDRDYQNLAAELLSKVSISADHIRNLRQKGDAEHKKILQSFWKQSLVFNPFNTAPGLLDIRFMPCQFKDQVFQKFADEFRYRTPPKDMFYYAYLLKAKEGAGKTGTILNAVALYAFLIYVQGSYNDVELGKGNYATPDAYDHFLNTLRRLEKRIKDGESKDYQDMQYDGLCMAFWWLRVKLLEKMRHKFPEMTPQTWIWWSTSNEGQSVVLELQKWVMERVMNMLQESLWYISFIKIRASTDAYSCNNSTWIAIDDANSMVGSAEFFAGRDILSRLRAASPLKVGRIIAGSNLGMTEELWIDGMKNHQIIYKLWKEDHDYPVLTSSEAIDMISKWINLKGISKEKLEQAASSMKGPIRYAVGFLDLFYREMYLYHNRRQSVIGSKSPGQLSIRDKDSVFDLALQTYKSKRLLHN